MTRVVDTSVVLAWYVEEEGSAAAITVLGDDLIAPNLLLTEIANAVWKKVRRGEIAALQASAILAEVEASVPCFPHEAHLPRALDLGLMLEHPVYDCVFLALAESMGLTLVTADRKFVRAVERHGHAASLDLIG